MDEQQSPALNETIHVTPPRSFWFDFFLLLGTFSFYTPFWFVSQVRDLKKLSGADVKPWAWFFVPWILLAQFWALPRFGRHLNRYEDQVGLDRWSGSYGWWVAAVILVTGWNNATYRLENLANWILVVTILAYVFIYSLLVLRIRRAKAHDPQIKAATHLKKSRWWEWLLIIVGTPISCTLLWFLLSDSFYSDSVGKIESGTLFEDATQGFEFPVRHIDWVQIETPDDEEDLYTFAGPNNEMIAYIYSYDANMTLNEVMTYRYSQAVEWIDTFDCEETQSFISGTLTVKAVQTCISTDILGADGLLTSLIDTGERKLELHIVVSTAQPKTGSIMRSARAAIEGFTLQ